VFTHGSMAQATLVSEGKVDWVFMAILIGFQRKVMHVSSIMNGELAYLFGIRDQASASQLWIKEDKVLCHEFLGVLPSCMCAHTYIPMLRSYLDS
jgi:hypothetical protein